MYIYTHTHTLSLSLSPSQNSTVKKNRPIKKWQKWEFPLWLSGNKPD